MCAQGSEFYNPHRVPVHVFKFYIQESESHTLHPMPKKKTLAAPPAWKLPALVSAALVSLQEPSLGPAPCPQPTQQNDFNHKGQRYSLMCDTHELGAPRI